MANCTVHTDFGELGTHKGYVADVGYDSGDEETQIDIIYEDQDIGAMPIATALEARSFTKKGRAEINYTENFDLIPIQVRPKRPGGHKFKKAQQMRTRVSPIGPGLRKPDGARPIEKKQGRQTRSTTVRSVRNTKKQGTKQKGPREGIYREAFTEPSIFKSRALFTGRRRQSERVAPGLGPGPAGGLKER